MSAGATIIKKKKVVHAHGHHGGAWKVAYADFVTAMMAFFLLMWLLNATTEEQRKGLADYFDPTIPISSVSGGGSEALFGDTVMTQKKLASDGKYHSTDRDPKKIEQAIREGAAAAGLADVGDRLRVTETEEGLLIELLEKERKPLFPLGSAAPSPDLEALLAGVAKSLPEEGARLKITGHTDSKLYAGQTYTNWELSSDRANTARRLLLDLGVIEGAVAEVVGKADTVPLVDDPEAPENRRIAIVLLGETAPIEDDVIPVAEEPAYSSSSSRLPGGLR
jgi:chemotaxis protein MotB